MFSMKQIYFGKKDCTVKSNICSQLILKPVKSEIQLIS